MHHFDLTCAGGIAFSIMVEYSDSPSDFLFQTDALGSLGCEVLFDTKYMAPVAMAYWLDPSWYHDKRVDTILLSCVVWSLTLSKRRTFKCNTSVVTVINKG